MVSFGEKAKIKKAGNLNYGRSYVTTTVTPQVYRSYICKPCSVPRAQLKVLWSQKTRIWRQPWNSIRFCKHPAFLHKVKNWFEKQHFSFSLILSNNNAIGSLAPFFSPLKANFTLQITSQKDLQDSRER